MYSVRPLNAKLFCKRKGSIAVRRRREISSQGPRKQSVDFAACDSSRPSGDRIYPTSCLLTSVTSRFKKASIIKMNAASVKIFRQSLIRKTAIFPSFIPNTSIPPNSPDLNVLDYCVWNLLKERLNKYGLIPNFEKLKTLWKKEWNAIPQKAIQEAVDSWLVRVYAVEKAGGGHIE